jgi:RimJ/RimL family protein N-acetyltransferase
MTGSAKQSIEPRAQTVDCFVALLLAMTEREYLMPWLEPVSLSGPHAQLKPLSQDHCDRLTEAVKDGELWKLWYTFIPKPEDMRKEIDRRLGLQAAGSMLPFTVLDAEGKIAGMTTYMNVDAPNRRVEIGSTWYARRVQRSALNTQCKLLLLTHAFEELDCIAVEFRTHFFNHQSRRGHRAVRCQARRHSAQPSDRAKRNPARHRGLQHHRLEWPTVKAHLTITE